MSEKVVNLELARGVVSVKSAGYRYRGSCSHNGVLLDPEDRRLTCSVCGTVLDPYEWIGKLAHEQSLKTHSLNSQLKAAETIRDFIKLGGKLYVSTSGARATISVGKEELTSCSKSSRMDETIVLGWMEGAIRWTMEKYRTKTKSRAQRAAGERL